VVDIIAAGIRGWGVHLTRFLLMNKQTKIGKYRGSPLEIRRMRRFRLLQSLGYWGYIENLNQMQA